MPLSSKPPVPGGRLNHRLNELIGILLLVAATLLFLSLISYHPADPSLDTANRLAVPGRPSNLVGPAGAYIADLLFQLFGVPCFVFAGGLALTGFARVRTPTAVRPILSRSRLIGIICLVLSFGALLAQVPFHLQWHGTVPVQGAAGTVLTNLLISGFNPIGAALLSLTLLVIGVFLATEFSISRVTARVAPHLGPVLKPLQMVRMRWQTWRLRALSRHKSANAQAVPSRPPEIAPTFIPARNRPQPFEDAATRARRELEHSPAAAAAAARSTEAMVPLAATPRATFDVDSLPVARALERPAPAKPAKPRVAGGYKMPSLSLLQEAGEGEHVDEDELRRIAGQLQSKCEEFDVRGQVTQINPGPVVTTYEYKPEPGIKYNRITALVDDLCLALEAESIYIERIPGKSTVGIEVPNRRRETIFLREIVESEDFHASRSRLTMALGKDINGQIVITDLAAMPHLLIAGSTGSGKSVALNSIIVSLLYKSTPDEVRFILVDPKRLELGLYDGIPHLYTPIITEPKLAANALRNATREMERRLKLLAGKGVRNIGQYNRLYEDRSPGLFDAEEETDDRPLPYIVIVIDELADLMIVDAKNVEESITRLAQMARAVGIHLILATQRPSVDVITGLIKANFPARMSFRVATKVDSRTILDVQGAESLLGKGDMLFLPPGSSRLQRVHGAFITEREISGVVDFWRKQAPPQLDESFLKAPQEEADETALESGELENSGDDPMYEDAVKVVLEYGKASTSLLQRRLRIGYGRAAHLIDLMYNDGIVGPADGPKPREVLKRPDWITEVQASQENWAEP